MVPACWPCNLAKKDLPAEVFRLTPAQRVEWLRSRGWLQSRQIERDPANRRYGFVGGRRVNVGGAAGAWWSPDTGKCHVWRWALRKAAWGPDAEPDALHVRRRYW